MDNFNGEKYSAFSNKIKDLGCSKFRYALPALIKAINNIKPVIRFKSKVTGKSVLKDLVQGDVEIENNTKTEKTINVSK